MLSTEVSWVQWLQTDGPSHHGNVKIHVIAGTADLVDSLSVETVYAALCPGQLLTTWERLPPLPSWLLRSPTTGPQSVPS